MSRHERQRKAITAAFESGEYARVVVLAREHLAEYPTDEEVEALALEARRLWTGVDRGG